MASEPLPSCSSPSGPGGTALPFPTLVFCPGHFRAGLFLSGERGLCKAAEPLPSPSPHPQAVCTLLPPAGLRRTSAVSLSGPPAGVCLPGQLLHQMEGQRADGLAEEPSGLPPSLSPPPRQLPRSSPGHGAREGPLLSAGRAAAGRSGDQVSDGPSSQPFYFSFPARCGRAACGQCLEMPGVTNFENGCTCETSNVLYPVGSSQQPFELSHPRHFKQEETVCVCGGGGAGLAPGSASPGRGAPPPPSLCGPRSHQASKGHGPKKSRGNLGPWLREPLGSGQILTVLYLLPEL